MVASYAWAAPGGILEGTRDLASAFLGWPVQVAEARRRRAADELARREANLRLQREAVGLARDTGSVPVGTEDYVDAFTLLRAAEEGRADRAQRREAQAVQRAAQRGEAVQQGFISPEGADNPLIAALRNVPIAGSFLDTFAPPSREQALATEGARGRAATTALKEAQAENLAGSQRAKDTTEAQRRQFILAYERVNPRPTPPKTDNLAALLPGGAQQAALEQADYERRLAVWQQDVEEALRTRGLGFETNPPAGVPTAPAAPAPAVPAPGSADADGSDAAELAAFQRLPPADQAAFRRILESGDPQKILEARRRLRAAGAPNPVGAPFRGQ